MAVRARASENLHHALVHHCRSRNRRCYFEKAILPSVFWVDLDKVNLEPRADVMMLETLGVQVLAGEVSTEFEPAEPFEWLPA